DIISRLDQSGQWAGESIGLRRNGLQFPEEMSLTRLEDGSFVCVVRDVTERTQAEEQIRHLAYHDPLTELPNRLLFRDRLNVALNHATRHRERLAVLFLYLDRFKVINDSLGHNAGDALLQGVAKRVRDAVRDSDTVARLGGDEFSVLAPALRQQEDAIAIARKVLDVIRAPFNLEGRELFVTTSIGVSIFPEDGEQADELIKNADTAMYQAKERGRNNIQPFNEVVNVRTLERLALENGLRRGLARSEFEMYYQPIVDLESGNVHGCEALLRWNHPDSGLIPPGNFIWLAEETGLMIPIGSWVLNEAASRIGEWHRKGLGDLSMAINVSASQIQQKDFIEQVRSAIDRADIAPEFLEIEITESYAMEDPQASAATLAELKEVGVSISVDDFGTGHSSLSYLKSFPIDTLKIDASFVRDMIDDEDTAEIVNAIIAMGHNLRLKVVAEGVEQEEHRVRLLEKRCDRVQGFMYSRPLSADAFEAFMRKRQSGKGRRREERTMLHSEESRLSQNE
ncbi:MAG: EAL domain-containing protein, partial [Thermoanaerobaculia bacterium]|nr:EAL domain-containing protein [Thermoanaerobaculia bacterium]